MKIIRKCEENTVNFKTLKSGDVFLYSSIYYMKLSEFVSTDDLRFNTVRLESGVLDFIYDGTPVVPVKCNLVVE